MCRCVTRVDSQGGLHGKRWRHSEVKAALQAQRLANHIYQPVVKMLSEQGAQEAWKEYQEPQEWLHGTKRAYINKLEKNIKDSSQDHPLSILASYSTVLARSFFKEMESKSPVHWKGCAALLSASHTPRTCLQSGLPLPT